MESVREECIRRVQLLATTSRSSHWFFHEAFSGASKSPYVDRACYGSIAECKEADLDVSKWTVVYPTDKFVNMQIYEWVMDTFQHCFEKTTFEGGIEKGFTVTYDPSQSEEDFWQCYFASIALRFAIQYKLSDPANELWNEVFKLTGSVPQSIFFVQWFYRYADGYRGYFPSDHHIFGNDTDFRKLVDVVPDYTNSDMSYFWGIWPRSTDKWAASTIQKVVEVGHFLSGGTILSKKDVLILITSILKGER